MVHPECRDAGHCRPHDVGRIEPAAQADLDDGGRRRRARKRQKSGGGGHLEEAGADPVRHRQHLAEQRRQRSIVDQPPSHPDTLVEADEVRRGIDMDVAPRRLDRGAQKGAGRPFAVGAGDVKHRRQRQVRIAETGQQRLDPFQPQYVEAGRQPGQPVELFLHRRIGGTGVIRHALRLTPPALGSPAAARTGTRSLSPASRADRGGARPCRSNHAPDNIPRSGNHQAVSREWCSRSPGGR